MMRIGHGYDVHRLVEGRPLLLGGVHIPHARGLLGHSDGDVVLHAIGDAILGALAAEDMGALFPDTDDRYRGADSAELLRDIAARMRAAGWHISNVDVTVCAEAPVLCTWRRSV